jgi:hypothetical protein
VGPDPGRRRISPSKNATFVRAGIFPVEASMRISETLKTTARTVLVVGSLSGAWLGCATVSDPPPAGASGATSATVTPAGNRVAVGGLDIDVPAGAVGVWQLRDPDPHLQRRHLVSLVGVRERRRLRAQRDPGARNRRHPDLHRVVPVGHLHQPDLRRRLDGGVRQLRDAFTNLQQRRLDRMVRLRWRRRLRTDHHPGLRNRRLADVRRVLPVGRLHRSDLRRPRDPGLRKLRVANALLRERRLVRLVGLRCRGQTVDNLVIDPSGDFIITGSFSVTLDLGGGPFTNSTGSYDGFVARLRGSDAAHVWSRQLSATSQIDGGLPTSDGNLVLTTGQLYGSADFGFGVRTATSNGTFLLALDATTGAPVFDKFVDGANGGVGAALGGRYLWAIGSPASRQVDLGGAVRTGAGALAIFDGAGAHLWSAGHATLSVDGVFGPSSLSRRASGGVYFGSVFTPGMQLAPNLPLHNANDASDACFAVFNP